MDQDDVDELGSSIGLHATALNCLPVKAFLQSDGAQDSAIDLQTALIQPGLGSFISSSCCMRSLRLADRLAVGSPHPRFTILDGALSLIVSQASWV